MSEQIQSWKGRASILKSAALLKNRPLVWESGRWKAWLFYKKSQLTISPTGSIKNLRLGMNHFVGGGEWEINLKNSNLTSLRGPRELQLFFNTYWTACLAKTTIRCRKSHPVDSVLRLSALQPCSAVVSMRHGHAYHTNDLDDLAVGSVTKECLDCLRNMVVDGAYAGEQCAKQRAVNDDWEMATRKKRSRCGYSVMIVANSSSEDHSSSEDFLLPSQTLRNSIIEILMGPSTCFVLHQRNRTLVLKSCTVSYIWPCSLSRWSPSSKPALSSVI